MRDTRPSNPSRRALLRLAPSLAGGALLARSRRAVAGSNDRIGIGMIGVGSRASAHLGELLQVASAQNLTITAVCDVYRPALEAAAGKIEQALGSRPRTVTRFQELLSDDQVDAVVIATPDFSHAPILVAALEAGKDVYIEKPMTIDLDAANRALDLAREKQRVVQAGTQRRSDGHFLAAAALRAEGTLGTLSRVGASVSFNQPRWQRSAQHIKPADVDWEAYLLHLEPRPFDPRLLLCWQLYRDTSNGMPGLWMTHYADAVHMITGASYPSRAVALGGTYVWNDGREHNDTFHAVLEYPEGFLFEWGMSLGTSTDNRFAFHGTEATLDAERWTIVPEKDRDALFRVASAGGGSHLENWLDCLRTRERPRADIAHGHAHVVATVMAALARDTGRQQRYDPETRTIQSSPAGA